MPTQIGTLTVMQLAEARKAARYLQSTGICTILEMRVIQALMDRIDDAVRIKRQEIDASGSA